MPLGGFFSNFFIQQFLKKRKIVKFVFRFIFLGEVGSHTVVVGVFFIKRPKKSRFFFGCLNFFGLFLY